MTKVASNVCLRLSNPQPFPHLNSLCLIKSTWEKKGSNRSTEGHREKEREGKEAPKCVSEWHEMSVDPAKCEFR